MTCFAPPSFAHPYHGKIGVVSFQLHRDLGVDARLGLFMEILTNLRHYLRACTDTAVAKTREISLVRRREMSSVM